MTIWQLFTWWQKRKTDHHVMEMVDSMSQKKRRGVQRTPMGDGWQHVTEKT